MLNLQRFPVRRLCSVCFVRKQKCKVLRVAQLKMLVGKIFLFVCFLFWGFWLVGWLGFF